MVEADKKRIVKQSKRLLYVWINANKSQRAELWPRIPMTKLPRHFISPSPRLYETLVMRTKKDQSLWEQVSQSTYRAKTCAVMHLIGRKKKGIERASILTMDLGKYNLFSFLLFLVSLAQSRLAEWVRMGKLDFHLSPPNFESSIRRTTSYWISWSQYLAFLFF